MAVISFSIPTPSMFSANRLSCSQPLHRPWHAAMSCYGGTQDDKEGNSVYWGFFFQSEVHLGLEDMLCLLEFLPQSA